jgi:MscS family membrane protein
MKLRFERFYRGFLALCGAALLWGLWAGAQTASNAPSLVSTNPPPLVRDLERIEEHPLSFGLDKIDPLRDSRLLGEPLWKYLASLIYILLAFYLAKLIDWIAAAWLKRVAHRTHSHIFQLLLELLRGPIKVVVFVILLTIGLNFFEWSPTAKVYSSKALILVVAGSLTYLAVKIVDLLVDIWKRRKEQETDHRFDDQLFSLIRKSLNVFVVLVAVLVTAQNLGINITAAITSLSIGGLAVGLAAQDTLANLFGAIAVFADRPFRIGDDIKLDGAEGTVVSVGLRSTRVRNPDGYLVNIPNKTMGNAIITNTAHRADIKTTMKISLAQDLPAEKLQRALEILGKVYRGHPMTRDVWLSFNEFAPGSLNVMIIHWWKGDDYRKYLAGLQEMNLAVKTQFDAEHIEFAAAP